MAIYKSTPPIVTNGLILHLDAGNRMSYPGSGTTWNDLSGNGRNLTLTNGPVFSQEAGGLISFDGTNDFAVGSTITNLGSSDRTVNIWVKQNTLLGVTRRRVFTLAASNGSDTPAYMLSWDSFANTLGQVEFGGTPSYDGNIGTNLTTGSWWNLSTSITSTKSASLYRNGEFYGSDTFTATVNANPIPNAGRYNGGFGQYSNAQISIIQIYNRILTPQEVLQNYNAVKTRFGLL